MPVHAEPSSLIPPPPPHHTVTLASEPRFRRCLRKFFAHLFSNLGLFGLVAGYVIVGAFVFRFLEAGNERQQRDRIGRLKNDCLGELWNITVTMHVLHELNWTKMVYEPLHKFETQIMSTTNIQGYDKNTEQWSLTGALLYSVTVITTIGYGNLAPKTPQGKIVTMVYALFGVPLMLLCISNLGSLLAGTFQFAYSHTCCSKKRKSESRREKAMKKCKSMTEVKMSPHSAHSLNGHHKIDPEVSKLRKPIGSKPVYRLTSEAKNVLCECAEYQLANSPTHDHVAAHILRQLGDSSDLSTVPEEDYSYNDENEDCYECRIRNTTYGTPSRIPLIKNHHQKERSQQILNVHTIKPSKKPVRTPAPPGVPVILVLLVLVGYICLGAAVFATWEDWTFIDGAYFCFVTLSTIGFGDFVPGKSFKGTDTQNGQLQLIACCGYLLFGLVLIAMSFSLVQEEVVSKCRNVARYMGLLKQPRPNTQPAPYAL
ncbi:potassium channel subfamily K member 18-like [Daktulosphaira vitifoliae]|uniref:potassium channel subfamily K member 18-like n=1 Tax=Daktulosphaira vitifoliae TaxID=58002 RepID=UPI0021A9F982|nr:potassium channel subfamily K member 18-like [Daktulosphaira vitifoliae]